MKKEVGRTIAGEEPSQLVPWVEKRLHQLRHGQEKTVLAEIAGLKKKRGAAGKCWRGSRAILPATPAA